MSTFDTSNQQIEELRAIKLQQPEVYKKIVEAVLEIEGEALVTTDWIIGYKKSLIDDLNNMLIVVDMQTEDRRNSDRQSAFFVGKKDGLEEVLRFVEQLPCLPTTKLLPGSVKLGIVEQDGKRLRLIPELEHKMDTDNVINLLKEGTKVALSAEQEVELKQKLQQFYDNNFPHIREIDRHLLEYGCQIIEEWVNTGVAHGTK